MTPESKLVIVKFLVILGFAFTTAGLTLGIVTFVIPSWFVFTPVSVTATPTPWGQFQRTRGIFQECTTISGLSVAPLAPFIKKGDCFENDIGQYPTQYNATDSSYIMIIRMRLSQLILHGISLVFSLVILFMGVGIILKWCCQQSDSTFYIKWRLTIGLISLLIFLLMSSSASLGTALPYVENFTYYQTAALPYSQFNLNVTYVYGLMYILAWVSAGFSLLAAIFFLITVCLGSSLVEEKYKPKLISVDNPTFTGEDNRNFKPIFLTPSLGGTSGITYEHATPNYTSSPGLLPRYSINT